MSAWAEAAVTTGDTLEGVEELLEDHSVAVKSIIVAHTDDESFIGKTVNATYRWLVYSGVIDESGDVRIDVPWVGTYALQVANDDGDILKGYCQVESIGGIYDGSLTGDVLFAFHYTELDSAPDTANYPAGYANSNWNDPAYMDFAKDEWHWGDWDPNGDHKELLKWFYPKSCMLNFNGTVDYYLDEDDETKKADGTASGVANVNGSNNAMMEWGQDGKKIYWKIVPDGDGLGFTYVVGNYQADEDMVAWNHYDANGNLADHFYIAKYNGGLDGNNRLRSISGLSILVSTTRNNEVTYARANNQTSAVIWDTEVYADWLFEGLCTCLITKSLDSQGKVGTGNCSTSAAIQPGSLNGKGMFYGKNNNSTGVKAFGKEHPWGNIWRGIRGLINSNGTYLVKLTHGRQDGSTATDYNFDGTGYISAGSVPTASASYISSMRITSKYLLPDVVSGSASTYYTDAFWSNNSQVDYALVGGPWTYGAHCGVFCLNVDHLASNARTTIGASLSCKPLAA